MYYEIININDISEKVYTDEINNDSGRVNRYHGDDLKRTLAGRILLKKIIYKVYGRDTFTVTYSKNGKPQTDFCFISLSHSGEFAACAVSDNPIGIDIQIPSKYEPRQHYLLFFSDESKYVNSSDNPEAAFYKLWTRKEAYIKVIDGTLSDANSLMLVSPDLTLQNKLDNFLFKTFFMQNYCISICEKK